MGIHQNWTAITCNRKPRMKLYRYFSNLEYAMETIKSGDLYLSLSDTFNDVFDCQIVNDGSILEKSKLVDVDVAINFVGKILCECKDFFLEFFRSKKEFNEMENTFKAFSSPKFQTTFCEYLMFVHKYAERKDTFEDFFALIKESYIERQPVVSLSAKVACFSEVNDSILMWAYYADKHQGVCLEYDLGLLDEDNEEHQRIINSIQKVYYSDYQYNNPRFFRCNEDINSIFFTKSLCWSHEQEWRIVVQENIEKIHFPCLTAVYLGAKFKAKYANFEKENDFTRLIQAILQKEDVAIYECRLDNAKYKLNFKTIHPGKYE